MSAFSSPFGDYDRNQYLDGTQVATILAHFTQNTAVTIGNTDVETTAFTTGLGSRTFQGGWFRVGSIVRVRMLGLAQTLNAAQTIQVRAYLGAVKILDTGAVTPPSLASPTAYTRNIDFSFTAIGATGSCEAGTTQIIYGTTPNSIGTSTAPSISTVNTTISNIFNITYTWGAANPANVVTVYGIVVECIG